MKTKLSPALTGLFVLGALALIVAGLLSFGSCHVFSTPARFAACFNESVQGLDVGSAVKLRGVRVGRVRSIRVYYDSAARQSQVAVVADLDVDVMTDRAGKSIRLSERGTLQRLIDEGLRAKIDLVGITGLQFVQLDILDPALFPPSRLDWPSPYPVVPTVPSGMSALIGNLSKIVTQLNKVDFAGISRELKSLLAAASQQIRDADLKRLSAKIAAAADAIQTLASSPDTKLALANFNATATNVQQLAVRLESQVEPVRAELTRTLRSFREAADNARQFLGPESGLSEQAVRTLRQLAETAESLQRLAEFLERNPNAVLTGKRRPDKAP